MNTLNKSYETWGVAMEVPEMVKNEVELLNQHDLICIPGALTSGLSLPSTVGPLLLNLHSSSFSSVAPTPITCSRSPGLLAVVQLGPSFPMAHIGTMYAALRANAHLSNDKSP